MNLRQIFRPLPDARTAARLLERFLDGDSTPAEERALYALYTSTARGSLAPELEARRDMMEWYAAMAPSRRRRRRIPAIAAGIGAFVAVAAGVTFALGGSSSDDNGLYACYRGSYVVHNGKRISDLAEIHTALARAEYTADSLLDASERQSQLLESDPEARMIDMAVSSIGNPELAGQIRCQLMCADDFHTTD